MHDRTHGRCVIMAALVLAVVAQPAAEAAKPKWVVQHPADEDFYIGVGTAQREGRKAKYRKAATDRALGDLCAQIRVTIASSFVQKLVERTGMTEEEARSEIVATTRARLTDYELVDSWHDRHDYWVLYRISKKDYARQQAQRRANAVKTGSDMLERAQAAAANDPASALVFYFSALAAVQDFVGDALETSVDGRKILLVNEIQSGLQRLLSTIELQPNRAKAFYQPGSLPRDPLAVRAVAAGAGGIGKLPIRFALADDAVFAEQVLTDGHGNAPCAITRLGQEPAYNLRARLDLERAYEKDEVRTVFEKMVSRLSVPETSILLTACVDEEDCLWRGAFAGEEVALLCAYEANGTIKPWAKMQDEVRTVLQNKGATVRDISGAGVHAKAVQWSASPTTPPTIGGGGHLVVMVASGKVNTRAAPNSPFGDAAQFAGEIRTLTSTGGPAVFADRYRGAGGWNPMGEEMCMDVMALHVLKRWKIKYLQHLGEQEK